jgi:hypothetical protein
LNKNLNKYKMAKLKNGILGAISGKLGPVTGGTWKGIPYLRMNPEPGANSQRSPGQLANQSKFKFGNEWLIPFHPFISVGYSPQATLRTSIAAAFSANYNAVISGVWPDLEFDYSKLTITKGKLPGLANLEVGMTGPNQLVFSWAQTAHKNALYNDQLIIMVYSHEIAVADGSIGVALRRDLTCTFNFTERLVGKAIEVYIGLITMDRKKAADSVYLGRIEP